MISRIFYREPYDSKPLLSSALTIIGGHSTLMDIMKVELENKVCKLQIAYMIKFGGKEFRI